MTNKPSANNLSQEAFEALVAEHVAASGAGLGVIFGSSVHPNRGFRHAADIDLGVDLATDHPEFTKLEVKLGRALRRPIDLIDLNKAPPQLRFEIARTGRLVHEARAYAYADFRAHAMRDWYDWQPIARRIHRRARQLLKEQNRAPRKHEGER